MDVRSSTEKIKSVYISFSKKNSHLRFKAASIAKERGFLPLYPNIVADLTRTILSDEKRKVSDENERFNQIRKSSEVWVIGSIEDDIKEDVELAKRLGKKIKYFEVERDGINIKEVERKQGK